MSIPYQETQYQETGRVHQKARTREALVGATRALLASGSTPTVEEAAAEADVSRTTAYRYFPTQQALLLAAYPEIGKESLLGSDPPAGVQERFAVVFAEMARQVLENEVPLRAMLRLSLEKPAERGALVLRRGRRRIWIADALEPLSTRLSADELDRLVLAVAAATGIEAYIWLTDIAGLGPERALEVMRFSADTLLSAAERDAL